MLEVSGVTTQPIELIGMSDVFHHRSLTLYFFYILSPQMILTEAFDITLSPQMILTEAFDITLSPYTCTILHVIFLLHIVSI